MDQTCVPHARNNILNQQKRSTKILWNMASRMCGEGSEHIYKFNKKIFAKTPWPMPKVRGIDKNAYVDLFRGILTAARQLWLPS